VWLDVRLTQEQVNKLFHLSARQDVSVAELIRDGIDPVMAKDKASRWGSLASRPQSGDLQ
jgi:hypothetical protein